MPTPQARYDNKHLAVLFALSRLLSWALNNPLQAMLTLLAMQAVLGASRSSREARDITPDITDITESFSSHGLDLEAKEAHFTVQDITEAYRARRLQAEQTCESSITLPDSGNAWALTLGGIKNDVGKQVVIGSDGSIVLTGFISSFGAGNTDVLLAQFTADGDLSWARIFGGARDDWGISLALKSDGSIVLTGFTASFSAGDNDVLLAQFAKNGTLSWAKTLGGGNDDVGYSLALKPDGGIVLTGTTQSFGAGSYYVLLAQFTENGILSWGRAFGGSGFNYGYSLALKLDGSIVLTGSTDSFGAGGDDVLLAQFTANGGLSWARTLGGSDWDDGNSLALKPDGSIVLTGKTLSFGTGGFNVLLAQFTENGSLSWAKILGGSDEVGNSLALKADGSIVLTGSTGSLNIGGDSVLLAQLTGNGTLSWARAFGGSNFDEGNSLALKPDGSIVLTGYIGSFGAGNYDVLLTVLSPSNTLPLLSSAVSFQDISLNSKVISATIASSIINPTITNINSLLIQKNAIPLTLSPILESAITPLSLITIPNVWQQPKTILPMFKYTYNLPITFLRYMASQPSLNIDLQGMDWLNYDINLKTISGTPINSFNKETQIIINPDTVVVARGSVYYGQIALKLCIGLDDRIFIKSLGESRDDVGNGLALKSDGSIVLTGTTSSFGANYFDVLLVQFTANGTLSWAKTFGGKTNGQLGIRSADNGYSLAIKPDGSIVLTGKTGDSFVSDVFLAQFTGNGILSWARTFGGGGDDVGNSLALKPDGSIVLTGYTSSFRTGYNDEVLLAQFTGNGTLSWARTFGGIGEDVGNSLALKPDGSIVLIGKTGNSLEGDVLLAQFTANGALSWARTFGGRNNDVGNSLALKPDGSIVLTGSTNSFGAGSDDILLAQFTVNGNLSWAKTLGGGDSDRGNSLALKPDGSIVLVGYTGSFGAGRADVLLAQFTVNGSLSWAKTLGGSNYDYGNSLALKPDGSIVLTGYTSGFGAGGNEVLLAQLNPFGITYYDNYLIQSISSAQSMSINPIVINITNSMVITTLNFSVQNWNITQNFTINPSVYDAYPYFKANLVSPVQDQPFNQTYSLSINTLLGYEVALLRLTELNKANLPTWLSYNPSSMLLSGTPTGNVRGNYYINMNLQHLAQQQEITFIINVLNTPPYYVGNTTLTTPTGRFVFSIAQFFRDNEADPIYPYAIAQLNDRLAPTIASIDATSGRLFGTALSGDQGTYQFNITVLDSFEKLGWQLITLQVINTEPKANVIFSNPAPVTVGNLFGFSFDRNAFIDPDGDAITYSAIYPSFLNFDTNTRAFYGTPQARDRGLHGLVIMARDNYGGQGNVSLVLDVNGIPARQFDLPILLSTTVGQPYAYTLPSGLFTDPDGDALSYDLVDDNQHIKPSWLSFNATSRTLFGTPSSNSHQAIPLRFKVSDGRGGEAYYDLALTIPNSAPVATSLAAQTVAVGSVSSLLIPASTFIDPDGDRLSYSVESLSGSAQNWLSLANDVITFFPKSGNQGQYGLKLMANDGFGGQASLDFIVTVPNTSPRLMYSIPAPLAASAKTPWSFLLDADNFADGDNDPLIYTASSLNGPLPAWINFNPSRRLFTGMPSGSDRGIKSLVVAVSDGFGGEAQGYFNVTVINSAPQADGRIFDQQVSKLEAGFSFTVPSFTDPDNDGVIYAAELIDGSALPSWLTFDASTRTFSATPKDAPAGNYLINVVATDSLGVSQKAGFNLAIQTPPNIDLSTSKTELAKNTAPFVGAAGLITLIAGILMWRQRRIKSTELRIQAWARSMQTKLVPIESVIGFETLKTQVQAIGEQLTGEVDLSVLETAMLRFQQQMRQYYAQKIKHVPMSTLLSLQIVEKFIQFVARSVMEVHHSEYDSDKTLGAARLLHCFIGLILSEHTGRRHQLSQKTKELYIKDLDELIARTKRKSSADIEILHELESAREALICVSDTNTLTLLCQASATHILSPGALVSDLRKLALDIPSSWYILLLELNLRAGTAKTDREALIALQSLAAKQTDWRFKYGMIRILLDIIVNTQNPDIRKLAITGQDNGFMIQRLGLLHLLQGNRIWHRNAWIQRQARVALNQLQYAFNGPERELLRTYLNPLTIVPAKRMSLIKTPLDHNSVVRATSSNKRVSVTSAVSDNPLYRTAGMLTKNPLAQTRSILPRRSTLRITAVPTPIRTNAVAVEAAKSSEMKPIELS